MRLRDPPKKGWKRDKTGWHIFVWSVYLIFVLIALLLYFTLLHDTIGLVFFWVTYTLAAVYVSVDFNIGPSEATKRNLLAISWGSGVALLIGSLFSYLLLTKVGLKEPYVSLTAIVTFVSALVAIGLVFLGRRIFSIAAKTESEPESKPNNSKRVSLAS